MQRFPCVVAILLWVAATAITARADDRTDCYAIGRTTNLDAGLYDPAIRGCTRLIAVSKGAALAAAYVSRGGWLHKKGNYDAAIADFDRAMSINPKNVEVYDYRGDSLVAKGDLDEAIRNYDEAIRVDPTYAAAYYSRGLAYEKKGQIDRARESYQAALVPPRARTLKIQERIQEWAQVNAANRLAELKAQGQ